MDYTNIVTQESIFMSLTGIRDEPLSLVARWILAGEAMKVREILIEWFNLLQEGKEETKRIDPFTAKEWPPKRVNKFIHELEEDFMLERTRFSTITDKYGNKVDRGPGFDRLKPAQRIALAQEVFSVLSGDLELEVMAKELYTKSKKKNPWDNHMPNFLYRGFCSPICTLPSKIECTHDGHIFPVKETDNVT